MKSESNGGVGLALDNAPPVETPSSRGRRGKRRTAPSSPAGGPQRFFLSQAESNGVPILDQELGSEAEAMLESLKSGRSYFVISEWRGSADLTKKIPQIRKESITAKKVS